MHRTVAALLAALAWAALAAPAPAQTLGLRAELVASGLTAPLFATTPPGDPRIFVVERAGRIQIVRNGAVTGTFLDIRSKVSTSGEGGLLGLAFAPDYATSGYFFVYYVELDGDSLLARYRVSSNPDVANATETRILQVQQPTTTNHKGGTIAFGSDGFLYWGLGDGGGSYDPNERAQDPSQLLGKMLRLDVRVPPRASSIPVSGAEYAIPANNPFASPNDGTRDEIWALGLRNPYRWSFDRETGDLWIADVGQSAREEIDFEPNSSPGGRNWGWDVMEGTLCVTTDPAPAPACNAPSLSLPLFEYAHGGGRCSVTGGYVYRGAQVPPARGLYFFGDFCTGQIWSLEPQTLDLDDRSAELSPPAGGTNRLVGFGEDGAGELLIVHSTGSLFRLALRTACSNGVDDDGDGASDLADPGCAGLDSLYEDPQCNDGVDNDRDGRIDLADPVCHGDPTRNREGPLGACGLGAELALLAPFLARLRRLRVR